MRLMTLELMNEKIDGTTDVSTSQEHAEILGRADEITYQFRVSGVAGTSPTITAKHWGSNDGKFSVSQATLLNAVALTANTPYNAMVDTGTTTVLGAFGTLVVTLGGTTPTAQVKVTACLRTR